MAERLERTVALLPLFMLVPLRMSDSQHMHNAKQTAFIRKL